MIRVATTCVTSGKLPTLDKVDEGEGVKIQAIIVNSFEVRFVFGQANVLKS